MQFHPAIGRHPFALADNANNGYILPFGSIELVECQSDRCRLWRHHHLSQIFFAQFLLQRLYVGCRQKSSSDQKKIGRTANKNCDRNRREIKETNSVAGPLTKELAHNDITASAD
jgi:hypothetical protein